MILEAHAAQILPAKVALIGFLGVGAQWLAWRMQWPAIVVMSAAGLLVGPIAASALGHPLIDPQADFGELFRPLVALAVAVILFEGGLALEFRELRGAGKAVRRLVFPGALIAWALGALAARYAAGLPWDIAALFGGLLIVTGPTVILPLLRQAKLTSRPAAVLRWEGIVNDPVGAILAVFVFEAIRFAAEGRGFIDAVAWIFGGALFGGVLGIVSGLALAAAFRRGMVPEFLKAPVVLASVLCCYVLADLMARETGLLAVTVFGMTIANSRLASIHEMRRFKETIATLLVSGVFVILTATLTQETIATLDWRALIFVAAILFIVRPATVWPSTINAGLSVKERALLGWIAPRGIVAVAVAGLFSTELSIVYAELAEHAENALSAAMVAGETAEVNRLQAEIAQYAAAQGHAERLTPLAFAVVFATVILHGFSIGPLAKRMGLAASGPEGVLIVGANPWSLGLAKALMELETPVILADTNWLRLRRARLEGVPVFFGEVLSEAADHRLDHSRYGWLVAASANDAYNSLVSIEFAPELGRHRVYQLSDIDSERDDHRSIAFTARGRTFIRRGRGFDGLSSDWWRGWRFRATKLTEEYDLERFFADRGEDVDLAIERRPDGKIVLLGPGSKPKGGVGATLLWFAPPKSDEPPSPPEPETDRSAETDDAPSDGEASA